MRRQTLRSLGGAPSRATPPHRRVLRAAVLLGAALLFGASLPVPASAQVVGSDVLYNDAADWGQGTSFNTETGTGGELIITDELTTYPVLWVANAGEDTVSKIDTNTGREIARYRTWFGPAGQPGHRPHLNSAYSGAAPSRTCVDSQGNVFVANRHFDNLPADVIKILANGAIDRNNNGVVDTSSDRNNNGVIDPDEIMPLGDTNGNNRIDPEEIQDEMVAWAVSVGSGGGLGRSLAIDPNGNVWLGLHSHSQYWKLSGVDGSILAGPIDVSPNTPYGALVDSQGILWGASLGSTLLKLDTNTGTVLNVYNHSAYGSDYGLAIGNGRVYQASSSGYTYIEFDPVTETFSTPAQLKYACLGIAVDGQGNIVAGNWQGGGATKFRPDGSVIWTAPGQPGTGEVRGCVIDSKGDVWLIHLNTDNISKHSGVDGSPLGVFPAGNRPYTYSDATGLGFNVTTSRPTAVWSVIQDSGADDTVWGALSWVSDNPEGTTTTVQGRAANSLAALPVRPFTTLQNGVASGLTGRYIEVKVTLRSDTRGVTPVLTSLRVATESAANQAPGVPEVVSPQAGDLASPTPRFVLEATDADNDQVRYTVELTQGTTTRTYESALAESGTEAAVVVPADQPLGSGEWSWRARATDASGNVGEWSAALTFTVITGNLPAVSASTGLYLFGPAVQSPPMSPADFGFGGQRIASWDAVAQAYVLDANVTQVVHGVGYWVRAGSPVPTRFTGKPAAQPYVIPLRPGWNLVSAPFMSPVAWNLQTVKVRRGTEEKTLADAFTAGWLHDYAVGWAVNDADPNTGRYVLVYDASVIPGVLNHWEPWKGYWVHAILECELVLPVPGGAPAPARAATASKGGWSVRLMAQSGQGAGEAVLGMSGSSRAMAVGIPPQPPGATGTPMAITVTSPEGPLSVDVRPGAGRKQVWNLLVTPGSGGRATGDVTLRWPDLRALPKDVSLTLVDTATGERRYMRTTAAYSYRSDGSPRQFQVVAEPRSGALLTITGLEMQTVRSGARSVRFTLSGPAAVDVSVLSPTGKAVAMLARGRASTSGMNQIVWTGTVSPGIYLLRATATSEEGVSVQAVRPVVITR